MEEVEASSSPANPEGNDQMDEAEMAKALDEDRKLEVLAFMS